MRRRTAILGLLLFAAPLLRAGEVLDGMAATVNRRAILQSDWRDEVRYEMFTSGRPLQSATVQDRKAALDRLIDQELLSEQMGGVEIKPVSPGDVERQLETVRNDYARDHGAQAWGPALAAYGLTEADIKNHITLEFSQLRLVDAHLRPSIQVDDTAIEAYYREHLAAAPPGRQPISLQQATPKIRELLTQEKMNELLAPWLESLRSQARIRIVDLPETQGPAQ